MIVGFTGTQNGLTLAQRTSLRQYLGSLKMAEFHHGDCIGADATAHNFVVHQTNVFIHPSDRKDKRAFCKGAFKVYPPKPPLKRNPDIVASADLLVACPKTMHEEQRSGTWTTVREALRTNKVVTVVWPDGFIQLNAGSNELDRA